MADPPSDASRPSLRAVGEFGLIERLAALAGTTNAAVGIGDDAAALDTGGPDYQLVTVDMLVEGTHFRLPPAFAFDVGRRAMAVNVSDIAAMGGEPRHALVSLAVSPDLELNVIEQLYSGMVEEARQFDTAIVGGNISRTDGPLVIDVVLLGRVPKSEILLRRGARAGDVLAVTGTLGERAALHLAGEAGLDLRPWAAWTAVAAVPQPRVAAARGLASGHLVHAMLDLSDGLAGDIRHLCAASRVGALVDSRRLPISPEVRAIARALGVRAEELALSGGEDYELLVALPRGAVTRARELVAPVPLHVIGEVVGTAESISLVENGGRRELSTGGSWRHF